MPRLLVLLALLLLVVNVACVNLAKPTLNLVAAAGGAKEEKKKVVEPTLNAFELCVAGSVATAFGDFVMHPIDTIKVTQQTSKAALSMLATARQIFATSGIKGFYPGILPYCTADGLSGAIKFASFELSKVFVEARVPVKYYPITQFVCAAGAMLACSVVLVPGEVIKTRLQGGMFTSIKECITSTLKQDGIGGLFAGYYATLVRDVPYTMLELGLYENIKYMMRKVNGRSTLTQQEELTAAAVTGGFTGFITTPLDVIKTKLMMQTTTGATRQYTGVIDTFNSIYKSGGLKALFVGSAARVSWLLPFTTIYLGVYEVTKRQLIVMKKRKIAAAASTPKK